MSNNIITPSKKDNKQRTVRKVTLDNEEYIGEFKEGKCMKVNIDLKMVLFTLVNLITTR